MFFIIHVHIHKILKFKEKIEIEKELRGAIASLKRLITIISKKVKTWIFLFIMRNCT